MAIIYETKEDFEREKLREQAKDMHTKAVTEGSSGLAFMLGATIVDSFNTKRTNGLKLASTVLTVIGIVDAIKSLFTASKAHDLKLEHDRMGPQNHVNIEPMPISEIHEMEVAVGEDPCHCKHHKKKSHRENAEKSEVILTRS